jgi:hypothetical protein
MSRGQETVHASPAVRTPMAFRAVTTSLKLAFKLARKDTKSLDENAMRNMLSLVLRTFAEETVITHLSFPFFLREDSGAMAAFNARISGGLAGTNMVKFARLNEGLGPVFSPRIRKLDQLPMRFGKGGPGTNLR